MILGDLLQLEVHDGVGGQRVSEEGAPRCEENTVEGYFPSAGENELGVAVERFRRVEDGLEGVGEKSQSRHIENR